MHSKFTDIQKADVIAQYWRGKPVTKICEEFAVSKSTVYAWIRPCSVKKEAAAVGRHVFIQKEMVNLQNKMCRLNTIIEILGKAECLRNAPLEDRLAEFHRLKGQYGTNILLEALNISKGTYHKGLSKKKAIKDLKSRDGIYDGAIIDILEDLV